MDYFCEKEVVKGFNPEKNGYDATSHLCYHHWTLCRPRLRRNIHLHHHLRTPHRFPHPPQQPQSTHSSRTITIPQMTTVPTYAHRCNPSSPNATSRTTSTLGNLSMFFEMMQPDNRLSPTPFSEIRDLFRNNPRSETSRGTSRSKRQMNPKREWCQMGWIN